MMNQKLPYLAGNKMVEDQGTNWAIYERRGKHWALLGIVPMGCSPEHALACVTGTVDE